MAVGTFGGAYAVCTYDPMKAAAAAVLVASMIEVEAPTYTSAA